MKKVKLSPCICCYSYFTKPVIVRKVEIDEETGNESFDGVVEIYCPHCLKSVRVEHEDEDEAVDIAVDKWNKAWNHFVHCKGISDDYIDWKKDV